MATKILHLDASLGVTVDGSNLVGQWNDQSGNNRHLIQTLTTNKPLLVENSLNGKPIVRFDGIDNYMKATFSTYQIPITALVVFKANNTANTTILIDSYTYLSNTVLFGVQSGFAYIGGGLLSTTTLNTTNHNIISYRVGATNNVRLNGVNEATTTATLYPLTDGITLGARANMTNNFINGDLAELIIYSDITGDELFYEEQKLSAKYNLPLSSLSTDFITLEEEQLYPARFDEVSVDFVTLEEEQLYPARFDEVSVDFVTLEEEQLPLQIPEELQEFSVTEQDLDFTTLEMSLIEKDILEDTPIFNEIILGESLDTFIPPEPVKVVIHVNATPKGILGKLF